MAVLKRTVEVIDAESEKLAAIEQRHRDRVVTIGLELAAVDESLGRSVIDAELAGTENAAADIAERVVQLTTERGISERAAATALERQRNLRRERWAVEASGLRRQADVNRREAARHEVKTVELLEALRAHEGCDYISEYRAAMMRPTAGNGVWVDPQPAPALPKSELLRWEAAELDARAAELEGRDILSCGGVEGDSVDELLDAVHALGIARVPSDESIRLWVAEQVAVHGRAVARSRGRLRFALAWTNGEIDGRARVRILTEHDISNMATREADRYVPDRPADRAVAELVANA